jgi:glucosamine-6-phosphate deaminase
MQLRTLLGKDRLKMPVTEGRSFRREKLKIEVYPTREEAGAAAAEAAAAEMKRLGKEKETISIIFATGASQLSTLRALTAIPGLPWERVEGFHMDEYVGIPPEHRASFRRYMRTELTERVRTLCFHEINGNASSSDHECQEYAEALRLAMPQLCLLGIGENGHLAFNDPGVADFEDPLDMKVVDLDSECKQQQVAEGWFASVNDVPAQALTLTIPALLRAPKLIVSVPGSRKAGIVKRTLSEAISTNCPATILRTHPDVTVYLDRESAAELET